MEKNNFESLSKNKINFVQRLALDDDIAKLMINGNKNYKDNVVTEAQKYGLMNTVILPYQKVMENITETKSYITMKFRYKATKSANTFMASYVTFYIFCHKDIIQTQYMTLRYDEILQAVNRLMNDTRGEWLGKLAFDTMEDVVMDSKGTYIGVAVTYKNTEFQ
jgi:hypothetical protein